MDRPLCRGHCRARPDLRSHDRPSSPYDHVWLERPAFDGLRLIRSRGCAGPAPSRSGYAGQSRDDYRRAAMLCAAPLGRHASSKPLRNRRWPSGYRALRRSDAAGSPGHDARAAGHVLGLWHPERHVDLVRHLVGLAVAPEEKPFHFRSRERPRTETAEYGDLAACLVDATIPV